MTDRGICLKNCEHVLNVRKAFRMKVLKGYHNLYLKKDVYLLACVRKESVISFILKEHIHYISAPGYS